MAGLGALGAIASLAGTVVSAAGTIAAGKQAQANANWQALEQERQAKAEQASAQREAQQLERRKDLALSRHQAVAAASGLSASDPTSLDIRGEIEEYGTMQQQLAQYGGRDRRAGLEAQATATRLEGDLAAKRARSSAIGTILGGIGGLARYSTGGGGRASSYYG